MQKPKEALTPLPMPIPVIPKKRKIKWEKALPEKHTISAIGESNSLQLMVKLETTDTSERKCVNLLRSVSQIQLHLRLRSRHSTDA